MKHSLEKSLDPKKLQLKLNNKNFVCETLLLTNQLNDAFSLESLKENEGKIHLKWSHESFGHLEQEITIALNAETFEGSFSIKAIAKQDVDALIIQTYGFVPDEEPYFMIPGNFYGTNNAKNSKSKQPQLNYRGDINYPKTPVYFTRADRSTHNTVLTVANGMALGVRINESSEMEGELHYNGLGIDTRHFDEMDRIALTLGFHHFPVHYYGKLGKDSHTDEPELGYIPFKAGKELCANGHIYACTATDKFAYENVVQHFYNQIHQHPGNQVDRKTAIKDLSKALLEDAFSYKYNYFPTVLSGGFADTGIAGDSGWTGGMQVVYPLVRAAKHVEANKQFAVDYISSFVKNAVNPDCGFFYENKDKDIWNVSGWWRDDLILYNRRLEKLKQAHSAYVNGQATCYILKSYQFAKAEGWEVEELESWFTGCELIIDDVISKQRYDGAFGVYFDPTNGDVVYYNSFQGVWFLAAVAEMVKLTGEEKYIKAFNKANKFYYGFLEEVELWGMPIDTRDAVDEEGNLAYITALKTMHEVTKEQELLDQLIHALHYEFSWKFAYNTKFKNEPLKSMNWSSSGGSITSSHNIHIHQMGNLIAEEMYYAYQQTGDEYILNRLKDTINWGLGTYNVEDNHFTYGKKGWATEQFFHSDGKQDDPNRIVDGGIWYDYLSWAAACVLLSSAVEIEDELYLP